MEEGKEERGYFGGRRKKEGEGRGTWRKEKERVVKRKVKERGGRRKKERGGRRKNRM